MGLAAHLSLWVVPSRCTKTILTLIDDLRQELVVNHSEEGELLQFLRVIVRWTTLRTRED